MKSSDNKKMIGFRADNESAEKWKVYATVNGMTMNELITKALDEYIQNHKSKEINL